ncbi:hypothetical protein KSP39_PZI018680 [Platanthera zijinensis]|uniref:Aconitase/3-isopropylmalate dehydratase large subunit alpha/beta/alpha domain-containing protein n=1 Tax=Platanthera zijinensis TaxID=2320716 RepID=A0AAP0B450_9ASPA
MAEGAGGIWGLRLGRRTPPKFDDSFEDRSRISSFQRALQSLEDLLRSSKDSLKTTRELHLAPPPKSRAPHCCIHQFRSVQNSSTAIIFLSTSATRTNYCNKRFVGAPELVCVSLDRHCLSGGRRSLAQTDQDLAYVNRADLFQDGNFDVNVTLTEEFAFLFLLIAPEKLPYSIRILLESAIRNFDVTKNDVEKIIDWQNTSPKQVQIPFKPARVLFQVTKNDVKINQLVPVDLVIDHSVQVDLARSENAVQTNMELEFQKNKELFAFLKWGGNAFHNMLVVPPGSGIVHQFNLEYPGRVVFNNGSILYPDSVVGTDSQTTMIDGWGVGGIEAEVAMLGQRGRGVVGEWIGDIGWWMGMLEGGARLLEAIKGCWGGRKGTSGGHICEGGWKEGNKAGQGEAKLLARRDVAGRIPGGWSGLRWLLEGSKWGRRNPDWTLECYRAGDGLISARGVRSAETFCLCERTVVTIVEAKEGAREESTGGAKSYRKGGNGGSPHAIATSGTPPASHVRLSHANSFYHSVLLRLLATISSTIGGFQQHVAATSTMDTSPRPDGDRMRRVELGQPSSGNEGSEPPPWFLPFAHQMTALTESTCQMRERLENLRDRVSGLERPPQASMLHQIRYEHSVRARYDVSHHYMEKSTFRRNPLYEDHDYTYTTSDRDPSRRSSRYFDDYTRAPYTTSRDRVDPSTRSHYVRDDQYDDYRRFYPCTRVDHIGSSTPYYEGRVQYNARYRYYMSPLYEESEIAHVRPPSPVRRTHDYPRARHDYVGDTHYDYPRTTYRGHYRHEYAIPSDPPSDVWSQPPYESAPLSDPVLDSISASSLLSVDSMHTSPSGAPSHITTPYVTSSPLTTPDVAPSGITLESRELSSDLEVVTPTMSESMTPSDGLFLEDHHSTDGSFDDPPLEPPDEPPRPYVDALYLDSPVPCSPPDSELQERRKWRKPARHRNLRNSTRQPRPLLPRQ